MTDSKDLVPPTRSISDTVHSIIKGGISSIPVGGLAAEIFDLFVVSPYQKRLELWMNWVAAELDELRRSDLVKWEDLEGDERFATILIQCTQAAMRQHQHEKLTLLLNALSNAAQQNRIEEDIESTFIRYIDELTVTHFILLTFLSENEKQLANIKEYENLLKRFSEDRDFQIGREEFRLFCKDLDSRLLVRFSSNMGESNDVFGPPISWIDGEEDKPMLKVTDLGLKLLNFVKVNKKNDKKEG